MNETSLSTEMSVHKATLSAVVIYEGFPTRERAMTVCDNLVKQFWPDIYFKLAWWRVSFLEDDGFAELAGQDAVSADFVIFSGSSDKELAPAVRHWFENWARHRDGRDGALVDLTETANSLNGAAELKKLYLRDIASRVLMDYVTKPARKYTRPSFKPFDTTDSRPRRF